MRIVKHDRGRLAREAKRYIEYDNHMLFGLPLMVSILCFVIFGLALTIEVSLWFLVILAPTVWNLLVGAFYLATSIRSTGHYAQYRNAAENIWPKIKVHKFEEGLGRPVIDKMYQHWQDGHPGSDVGWNHFCNDCNDRLGVLQELVPAQIKSSDKSDIEAARNFLDSRKELER